MPRQHLPFTYGKIHFTRPSRKTRYRRRPMEQYNIRNIRREFGEELASKVSLLLDYTDTPGDIDDPWYNGGFDVTYKEITRGCEGLINYLGY